MKRILAIAVASGLLVGGSVSAAPIADGSGPVSFSQGVATFTFDPGDVYDGSAFQDYDTINADRRDAMHAIDGDLSSSSFLSLGRGGSFKIDVSPEFFGPNATAVEITFGTSVEEGGNVNFPESAKVFGGDDEIGEMFNDGSANGGVTATLGSGLTTFSIDVPSGLQELKIVDTTFDTNSLGDLSQGSDGFDIGNITFETRVTAVPAPASLGLLGVGLMIIGLLTRRRNRA